MDFGANLKCNHTNHNNDNLKSVDPNQRIKENISAPRKGVMDSSSEYNNKDNITHGSDYKNKLQFKQSVQTLTLKPIQNLKVS